MPEPTPEHVRRGRYLAGEDVDLELSGPDRARLDRLASRLADPTLWEEPPSDGQFRLLAAASQEATGTAPDQLGDATPQLTAIDGTDAARDASPRPPVVEAEGGRDERDDDVIQLLDRRRDRRQRATWFAAGAAVAVAAAAIAFVATGSSIGGDDTGVIESEVALTTLELTATALDPDATGTLTVMPTPAGVEFELNLMGLDNSVGDEYYAAWLVSDDEAIPLGTFHWRAGGVPIILWSGVDDPAYDRFVITRQIRGEGSTPSGEVVLTGAVPSLIAEPTDQQGDESGDG